METAELFDASAYTVATGAESADGGGYLGVEVSFGLYVTVRVDVGGFSRELTYGVPDDLKNNMSLGALVWVKLKGRSTKAWVTSIGDRPPNTTSVIKPIDRFSSIGPSSDLLELADWVAWRYGGSNRNVLRAASPPRNFKSVPRRTIGNLPEETGWMSSCSGATRFKDNQGGTAHRVALDLVAADGCVLVVTPQVFQVAGIVADLRKFGVTVNSHESDWLGGYRNQIVVGTINTVLASVDKLCGIVVMEEGSPLLTSQRAPTWSAREVALERSKRHRVPCVLVDIVPSAQARRATHATKTPKAPKRSGWAQFDVIDQSEIDPSVRGLFSPELVKALRKVNSAVLILNRRGRAKMMVCRQCREIQKSDDGTHLLSLVDGALVSPRTNISRPVVCSECGSTDLRALRLGIESAATQASKILGVDVIDVSAGDGPTKAGRFMVCTEAALYRQHIPDLVCFLDFDQELLSRRYTSGVRSLRLLAMASRMVNQASNSGKVLIQTSLPDHRVITAAQSGDVESFWSLEEPLYKALKIAPYGTIAKISGEGAHEYVELIQAVDATLEILGPVDGSYLVRSAEPEPLLTLINTIDRPKNQRVRVEIDPVDF